MIDKTPSEARPKPTSTSAGPQRIRHGEHSDEYAENTTTRSLRR